MIDDHELVASLRDSGAFTLEALSADHGVTHAHVEALYAYARFKFDLGHYAEAGDYLHFFRQLAASASRDEDKSLLAAWGKLAAEILRPDTPESAETCREDIYQLRELIDNRVRLAREQVNMHACSIF